MKKIQAPFIFALMVVAFLAGIVITSLGEHSRGLKPAYEASVFGTARTPVNARDLEQSLILVAERVNPMVVQIHSERVIRPNNDHPFGRGPWNDDLRRPNQDGSLRTGALGSGVVVRPDGYILTNNHVIEGADNLEVKFFDGSYYDAEVIGADPASDLAIIHINATDLPAIAFGDMSAVRVGQWVLAFGSPLAEELGNSVTSGIVSALGRTSAGLTNLNIFAAFIQTDAAINPGNSGGPLVDLDGRLIGLNSAIFSRSGGYQGIGFAIPVDVARNVSDQLVANGRVTRGYLGVLFSPVSSSLARALDVPRGAAQVSRIEPGTPAGQAGLGEGDIIIAVNGHDLHDANQLRTIVGNLRPGDAVDLTYVRDGAKSHLAVTLGTRPDSLNAPREAPNLDEPRPAGMDALGLQFQDLSTVTREQIGLDGSVSGVLISGISEGSPAFRDAGLRRLDIITAVDAKKMTGMKAFAKAYEALEPGTTFIVRVVRPARTPNGATSLTTFITALTKPE